MQPPSPSIKPNNLMGVPMQAPSENEVVLLAKNALQSREFCSLYPFGVRQLVRYWGSKKYRRFVGSFGVVYPSSRAMAFLMRVFGRRRVVALSPASLMINVMESVDLGKETILCLGLSKERYKSLRHRLNIFFPNIAMEGSLSRSLLRRDLGNCITLLRKLRPSIVLVSGDLPTRVWRGLQAEWLAPKTPKEAGVGAEAPLSCLLFCSKALRRYSRTNKRTKGMFFARRRARRRGQSRLRTAVPLALFKAKSRPQNST